MSGRLQPVNVGAIPTVPIKAPTQLGRGMFLNEEQVESLLDVINCAKEFVSLWNGQEERRSASQTPAQTHIIKTVAQAAYNIAVERLMLAYAAASELEVSDELLMEEIHKILPDGMEFTIKIEYS